MAKKLSEEFEAIYGPNSQTSQNPKILNPSDFCDVVNGIPYLWPRSNNIRLKTLGLNRGPVIDREQFGVKFLACRNTAQRSLCGFFEFWGSFRSPDLLHTRTTAYF